ncbi:MAG: hypothetical protein OXU29_04040 [Gammaproteobacteria bacterium]|nr:hypothetical protein [Gammaproteobacteria bacterium]
MSDFNWLGLIIFSIILLATPGPAVISLFYSGINPCPPSHSSPWSMFTPGLRL